MPSGFFSPPVYSFFILLWFFLPLLPHHQPSLGASTMQYHQNSTIRQATYSDLDALTRIGIAAFPHEPQWPYRYPYAAQFPEDHLRFTRLRYSEWLDAAKAGDCIIMVGETPSIEDQKKPAVVSLSIWRIPQAKSDKTPNDKMKPPKPNSSRRDANPLHVAAYRKSVEVAQEELFDRTYGLNQLSLAQLATHPDYWRRGIATTLLNWGVERSRRESWPITVFAGPTAYKLYEKFGFKTAGTVSTAVSGEEETIDFPGLVWVPESSARFQENQPRQLRVTYDPATQS